MTKFLRQRLLTIAAVCLASCVGTASAQNPSTYHIRTSGTMGGIHYGVPLKWSVALGFVLPGEYKDWQPFIAAEPGIGGWRGSLGELKMTNELGGGYALRASVLRTGKRAWRAPSQATYVGPEYQYMPIFAIGVRAGGFIRVGGKGSRGLLTTDLNLLF